jgi:hypothetical protein
MSKFEIELELLAVATVNAGDENTARTLAYTSLESRLKLAAKALGVDELELHDVVGSESVPEASRNETDDAEVLAECDDLESSEAEIERQRRQGARRKG